MSLFGVILVRIFLRSDWIRRDTEYLQNFNTVHIKCLHWNESKFKNLGLSVAFFQIYNFTKTKTLLQESQTLHQS